MAESEWPIKFYQPFFCLPPSIIPLFTIAFLTRFTSTNDSYKKRSVGRPRKTRQSDPLPISSRPLSLMINPQKSQVVERKLTAWMIIQLIQPRSYSLQFKLQVVNEIKQPDAQIGQIAERHNIPRSTIFCWVSQLDNSTKKIPINTKGCHLRPGSSRSLLYPTEVDEQLAEWVFTRRDCKYPLSLMMHENSTFFKNNNYHFLIHFLTIKK